MTDSFDQLEREIAEREAWLSQVAPPPASLRPELADRLRQSVRSRLRRRRAARWVPRIAAPLAAAAAIAFTVLAMQPAAPPTDAGPEPNVLAADVAAGLEQLLGATEVQLASIAGDLERYERYGSMSASVVTADDIDRQIDQLDAEIELLSAELGTLVPG